MKKMEILVEEKTENQVKKRKFVKVKKRKKSRNYHPCIYPMLKQAEVFVPLQTTVVEFLNTITTK